MVLNKIPLYLNPQKSRLLPFILTMGLAVYLLLALSDLDMYLYSYMAWSTTMVGAIAMIGILLYRHHMTRYGFYHFLYMALILGVTLINSSDIKSAIYMALGLWLMLILVEFYTDRMDILLPCFAIAFSVCVYLNLLHIIAHPQLIVMSAMDEKEAVGFLLGNNYNQMGSRMMLALISSILSIRYSKWWLANTIALFITCIGTLAAVGCMTSLTSIVILAILLIVPSMRLKKLGIIGLFVVFVLFQVFVVFTGKGFENNEMARYLIEDVLDKDITFTNRTEMWDSALRVISKSPIFGYGLVDNEWYTHKMSSFAIGPHNLVLSIFIHGGILLFALFVTIFTKAIMNLRKVVDNYSLAIASAIVDILFMGLMEMFNIVFVFFILTLAYHYPDIDKYNKQLHS